MPDKVEEFLKELYRLDALDNRHACTNYFFDYIDTLFWNGEFDVCDEILQKVNTPQLSTSTLRSLLVITHAAKDKLKNRPCFYIEVEEALIAIKGKDYTERLLKYLK